MRTGSS